MTKHLSTVEVAGLVRALAHSGWLTNYINFNVVFQPFIVLLIVREDELEIEHLHLPLSFRGLELLWKFPANSDLKINQSVQTP